MADRRLMKKRTPEYNRLYDIHRMMKKRCYDPANKDYKFYGARNIAICSRWWSFDLFYKWCMDNGYKIGLSVDRIDNNQNYSPKNCRFVTVNQQGKNTRRCRRIKYRGHTYTMADFCRAFSLNYNSTRTRLNLGWDIEKILSTPAVIGRNQWS